LRDGVCFGFFKVSNKNEDGAQDILSRKSKVSPTGGDLEGADTMTNDVPPMN
jgi:hypothetical protein